MTNTSTELFDGKTLALPGENIPVWEVRPLQLVSLLEMLEHNAHLFYLTTRNLYELQIMIEREIKERGGMSTLTKREIGFTNSIIDDIRRACLPLQLFSVLPTLSRFNNVHFQSLRGAPFTLEQLRVELDRLVEVIAGTLSHNKFMMVPENKAEYYGQPKLFGFAVAERFPKANKEITEAGNCYATGNNTACVFHLMRVLEYGLRALAKKLKVRLPRPTEFEEWGKILGGIEKEIDKIEKLPKTRRRQADLEFYHGAAAQFRHFKNAWRNHVMHTQGDYDEYQAMSVMVHVREFTQHLATRLKG